MLTYIYEAATVLVFIAISLIAIKPPDWIKRWIKLLLPPNK